MPPRQDSREIRNQQSRAVRAKAPIAANYEDCLQSFDRLCAAVIANRDDLGDQHIIAEDCLSRLKTWGRDSGASTRALDHALRKSLELRSTALELLSDLHTIIKEANEVITPHSRDFLESPLDLEGSISSSTEEIGILEDRIPDVDIEQHLEEVVDVVDCLFYLLPNIHDPIPDEIFEENTTNDDSSMDIRLAIAMFPKAPISLNQRLGRANWQRRQNLRFLHSRRHGGVAPDQQLAFHPQNTHSTSRIGKYPDRRAKQSHRFHRRSRTGGTSEAGMSTAVSTIETIFSRTTFLDGNSMTSIADSEEPSKIGYLMPPDPPVPLISGSTFNCPYCRLEIVIGDQVFTREDWITHVYLDLEPYLCTFDDCNRADKTFGVREDWFQHELYCHRVQKVWFCRKPLCRTEFGTRSLFEKHLQSTHRDLFHSSQLPILINNCERYSEQPLPKQTCPLCGTLCVDPSNLKNHLGIHLEQLALTAIADGGCSDEELSADGDDAATDGYRSEFLLDEFVEEQFGYYWPKATNAATGPSHPPHNNSPRRLSSSNLDVRRSTGAGTSDTSDLVGNAEATKTSKDDLWAGKVEEFLSKQSTVADSTNSGSVIQTIRSNSPPRNVTFVGRGNDLKDIQGALTSSGHICVLSGCGGVGKTSAAIEYSYRNEREYSYVFWVEAETPGGCADTYSLIASHLNLGNDIIHDEDGLTILVREFLQRTEKRWLLIFDNVEDWLGIARYIPRNLSKTAGSVLITTRKTELIRPTNSKNYHPIQIDSLNLEESRQLLLCSMQPALSKNDLRSHPEYDLAAKAAKLVDGLPLAISMIAGFVQVSRSSISEFLEIWDERQLRTSTTCNAGSDGKDPHCKRCQRISSPSLAIDILWDIGIRELSVAARNLLDILTFLDSETIPKTLLVDNHKEPFLEFLNSAETIRYRRMIAELTGRRLVATKEQGGRQILSTHRLLQEKILHDLPPTKFTEVFGKAYCLVRKRFPPASPIQKPEPHQWAACKEYTPHVLSLRRAFKSTTFIESSVNLAQLFYDAGFHVWERQTTTDEGVLFLETAEEILNKLDSDKDARLRADIHSILSNLYDNIGTSKRADSLHRRKEALRIREKIRRDQPEDKDNDVLLTNTTNDWGISLLETNAFDEAGKMFEACYRRYCEWGTEDDIPFEYGKFYHNTGRVRMCQGKYPEAIDLVRKAVKLTEKSLGKMWRYWSYQFTLACVLLQSGDLQAALDLHLEVFNNRKTIYGSHDSYSILSGYAVGAMYHHLGNPKLATAYFKECIQMSSGSKWSEEALGRAKFHLSMLYREQGIQLNVAEELEKEAMKVLDKYPTNAPEYLRSGGDLMIIFDDLQPAESGRFTGINLLRRMQDHASRS